MSDITPPPFLRLFLQSMDLSQSALQVSQPSANTGGMISSAAASVTSWFRAYTGQRWSNWTGLDRHHGTGTSLELLDGLECWRELDWGQASRSANQEPLWCFTGSYADVTWLNTHSCCPLCVRHDTLKLSTDTQLDRGRSGSTRPPWSGPWNEWFLLSSSAL